MLALIPLNIGLVGLGAGSLYTLILIMQLLFYCGALAGWLADRSGRKNKLLYIPYYFLFMNINIFRGIRYLSTHKTSGTWEKARRA